MKVRSSASSNAREFKRLRTIKLFNCGRKAVRLAEVPGVTLDAVSQWLKRYGEQGFDSLIDGGFKIKTLARIVSTLNYGKNVMAIIFCQSRFCLKNWPQVYKFFKNIYNTNSGTMLKNAFYFVAYLILAGYFCIFMPASDCRGASLSFDHARDLLHERNHSLKAAEANIESKKMTPDSLKWLHGPTVSVGAMELWGEVKIDVDRSIATPSGSMPVDIKENYNFRDYLKIKFRNIIMQAS